MFTTAVFQVVHMARARTVSMVSCGWNRTPPHAGPRASLCCLDLSVVETYRKGQTVLMGRLSKEGARRRVEPHEVGEPIELGLGIGERVEGGDIIHEWIPLLLMIAHCRRELGIRNEELGMQHTHSLRSGGRLGGNS